LFCGAVIDFIIYFILFKLVKQNKTKIEAKMRQPQKDVDPLGAIEYWALYSPLILLISDTISFLGKTCDHLLEGINKFLHVLEKNIDEKGAPRDPR
jgi:hypothetical protein